MSRGAAAGVLLLSPVLGGCFPFIFVLPVPAPIVVNHPHRATVVDAESGEPLPGTAVRVRIYKILGDEKESLARDFRTTADAQGRIYLPKQTDPGFVLIWGVGVAVLGAPRAVGVGGVVSTVDAGLVLTLSRDGYATREAVFREPRGRPGHRPPFAVPSRLPPFRKEER